MNMKSHGFVILLSLCASAYSEKLKTTCLSQTNVRPDKRNTARVILEKDKMGLSQCGKLCNQFADCGAINFNKDLLRCELVGTGAKDAELVNTEGWKFMYKTDFQQMYVPIQSSSGTRYIQLSSGQNHNLSVELTYTDCLYTPTPGVYNIKISETSVVKALCQAEGWMVIQHKIQGLAQNFNRSWNDYKYGFGNPDGEHWLGNENVYQYSAQGQTELKVVLDNNLTLYAQYESFQLSSEADKYRLAVDLYSGNAGDSLRYKETENYASDGMMFTTIDSDNDICPCNCAPTHGGWWSRWCSASSLNSYGVTWMLQARTQSKIMIRRK